MPSQHFVHGQDRSVIPEIEPASRPQPVVRVLDQASIHGIVVQVIQFLINLPKVAMIYASGQIMQMIEAVIVL
jgi:hypothetical protein